MDASGEGPHLPVVAQGDVGCDERTAFCCALYDDDGVCHTCHDAVALHEVPLVDGRAGHVFREQSALPDHLLCRLAVHPGIYLVQAVSQDAHRRESVLQGCPVAMYIDAIGQTAYHECIGAQALQVGDEGAAEVLAVAGDLSGADHADDVAGIEVGCAHAVEQDGRIGAVPQALGIVLIGQAKATDATFPTEVQLLRGTFQIAVHRGDGCASVLRSGRQQVFRRMAVLIDSRS